MSQRPDSIVRSSASSIVLPLNFVANTKTHHICRGAGPPWPPPKSFTDVKPIVKLVVSLCKDPIEQLRFSKGAVPTVVSEIFILGVARVAPCFSDCRYHS